MLVEPPKIRVEIHPDLFRIYVGDDRVYKLVRKGGWFESRRVRKAVELGVKQYYLAKMLETSWNGTNGYHKEHGDE